MKSIYTLLQKITLPIIITLLILTVYFSFNRSHPSTEQPTNDNKAFIPLTDEPIMGYWFSEPKEIESTQAIEGIRVTQWLSQNYHKVLIIGFHDIGILDLDTHEITIYATNKAAGGLRRPVWLNESEEIAYASIDIETRKQNLWITNLKTNKMLINNVTLPIVLLPEQQGIAVYSFDSQSMEGFKNQGERINPVPSFLNKLPPPVQKFSGIYRATLQPTGNWLAYYNVDQFLLINIHTEEQTLINLDINNIVGTWVLNAYWSQDGEKLALLVTNDLFPVSFSKLYILEIATNTVFEIETPFRYIVDVAWGPDSQHLLFESVIDNTKNSNTLGLYIVNIANPTKIQPIPIPTKNLSNREFEYDLAWSPDGKRVIVKYIKNSKTVLNQLEVNW